MENNCILTDFHSHILPGADHGSDGDATSAQQLHIIKDAGVERVVATPHFYPNRHRVESFLERRSSSAAALDRLNAETGLTLLCGAEVLVCEGLEHMEGLDRLTVCGTDIILLEMPMTAWSDGLLETVENIRLGSLTPVMAHIDRYPVNDVLRLLELGVKAQLNTESICRLFGRKQLIRWIEDGTVVAIGSDLHGAEKHSYRHFTRAVGLLGPLADEIMRRTDSLISSRTVKDRI